MHHFIMKKIICVIFILLPAMGFSQLNFDTTKVLSQVLDDSADSEFFTSYDGLVPLARSANFIEIRLYEVHVPAGRQEVRVISFDGKGWQGKLVSFKPPVTGLSLYPKNSFIAVFNALNREGLFQLRNQKETGRSSGMTDGVFYIICYKAGAKFRKILFNNPREGLKLNPTVKEFRQYCEIVRIFSEDLVK